MLSISEALVTFFLPEDLGTYLVVGEGVGAGIWAPQKMTIQQHRTRQKAGRENMKHLGFVEVADISVNHNGTVSSWLSQEGEFGDRAR